MKAYQIKVAPPRLGATVSRERLFRRLDELAEYPLTWVSSPAGSGKTTLMASYVRFRDIPTLWYRIDEGDGDVGTFFFYMRETAKRLKKGRSKPLPLFYDNYRIGLSMFACNYFGALFATMPRPGAIVFDNYQDVDEHSEIHDVIRDGIKTIPDGLRVFMVSRKRFPLPFVSLQAENALVELEWEELRFTVEEVRQLMSLRKKAEVPEAAARSVHERTEGWAAAIVLITDHGKVPEAGFADIRSFDQGSVLDYFAIEVFEKLNPQTRSFLLNTALISSVSPDIAVSLTGVEASSRILGELVRNHYFVDRYGDEYRYHPLFREFLLSRFDRSYSPEERHALSVKTARALLGAGRVEEALKLLMDVSDWDGYSAAVVDQAPAFINSGRYRALAEWISRVPEEICARSPWLTYWLAVGRQLDDPVGSYELFDEAFGLFQKGHDQTGTLLAWSGAVQSLILSVMQSPALDRWIEWLDAYLSEKPLWPTQKIETIVTSRMVGALLARQPDRSDFRDWIERDLSLARSLSDRTIRLEALHYATLAFLWLGDFRRYEHLLGEIEQTSTSDDFPSRIWWYWSKAVYINQAPSGPATAIPYIEKGMELSVHHGIMFWVPFFLAEQFNAAASGGNIDEAREILTRMESILDDPPGFFHIRYHCASALYHVLTNDVGRALANGKEALGLAVTSGHRLLEGLTRLWYAFVLAEAGEYDEAEGQIREYEGLPVTSSTMLAYLSLILRSTLALNRGTADGEGFLREALATGRREGYGMPYCWWQPDLLVRLCTAALQWGIEVDHVRNFIRTRNLVPRQAPLDVDVWPWQIRITTFGTFGITVNDEPLRFTGKVQRRPLDLLKALVALGSVNVRADLIEDLLWPDADGDMARISFKTTLSRLRRLLSVDGAIDVKEGKASLNRQFVWLDTWVFEHLNELVARMWLARGVVRSTGETDMSAGFPAHLFLGRNKEEKLPDETERIAELAGKVYEGDFLGADARSWIIPYRERFRTMYIRMVRRLGVMLGEQGNKEKAAVLYEHAGKAGFSDEEIHNPVLKRRGL